MNGFNPCPFCGSTSLDYEDDAPKNYVSCKGCKMNFCWEGSADDWHLGEGAEKRKWNTRAIVDNHDRSVHVINPPACVLSVNGIQNPDCKPTGNLTKVCDNPFSRDEELVLMEGYAKYVLENHKMRMITTKVGWPLSFDEWWRAKADNAKDEAKYER